METSQKSEVIEQITITYSRNVKYVVHRVLAMRWKHKNSCLTTDQSMPWSRCGCACNSPLINQTHPHVNIPEDLLTYRGCAWSLQFTKVCNLTTVYNILRYPHSQKLQGLRCILSKWVFSSCFAGIAMCILIEVLSTHWCCGSAEMMWLHKIDYTAGQVQHHLLAHFALFSFAKETSIASGVSMQIFKSFWSVLIV